MFWARRGIRSIHLVLAGIVQIEDLNCLPMALVLSFASGLVALGFIIGDAFAAYRARVSCALN